MTILRYLLVALLCGAFILFWRCAIDTNDYRYGVRAVLCMVLALVLCLVSSKRKLNRKK